MAALVAYEDFVYPYNLDTDNENVQVIIDEICVYVEDWCTNLISTDITDDLKKEMIKSFSYALYCSESLRINTEIGNIDIAIEGATKGYEKSYSMYNKGVDIFNTYVVDCLNEMRYVNRYGI